MIIQRVSFWSPTALRLVIGRFYARDVKVVKMNLTSETHLKRRR